MKEWKLRQQYTHKLHEHTDLLKEDEVRVWKREEIRDLDFLATVLSYFQCENTGIMHYPQKSYSVALVYAKLLEKYFGENLREALNDPDLLLGDKFFVPYAQDQATYDLAIETLSALGQWDFESNPIPQVQATVRYFKKEFLLD